MIATSWKLARTQLDEHALQSHARATTAIDSGPFDTQFMPVSMPQEDGTTVVRTLDEGVRRGGSLDTMAGLATVFDDNGVVTAGNSSQISDGASALLITSTEKAKESVSLAWLAETGAEPSGWPQVGETPSPWLHEQRATAG